MSIRQSSTYARTPSTARTNSSRIVTAWLSTALLDGLFSSALSVFAYNSTASRVWEGVAATVKGSSAINGGTSMVLLGLVMHLGVALAWTLVFAGIVAIRPSLRRLAATPTGVVAISIVYGPLIWLVMSLIVIPLALGHAIPHGGRWLVQLIGHVPFVALPMVAILGRPSAPVI